MKNITPIILIILSVAIFLFFIDPQYKKIQETNVQINQNKETLKIADELKSKKIELDEKFNQIAEEDKDDLGKLLPDTVDNVRLIIDINNVASQFGIVIRDINIDTKDTQVAGVKSVVSQKSNFDSVLKEDSLKYVDTSKIGVISFSFSVSAKYEVFLEFLKQLEESLRIVDIRDIQISQGNGGIFYDYKVTLDTYWLK
jgi:hypothetical protein